MPKIMLQEKALQKNAVVRSDLTTASDGRQYSVACPRAGASSFSNRFQKTNQPPIS